MFHARSLRPRVVALVLYVTAFAGVAGCAKVSTSSPNPTNPADAGSLGAKDGIGSTFTDAPMLIEAGSCATAVVCTPPNGRYCETIGDGCGGTMNCGACPGTKICESNVCVSGADCTPMACQTATSKYCGTVGDGCGRAMDCGGCDGGQVCSKSGLCVSATCVPSTCNAGTSRYCGVIGDGCGGSLDCGVCAAPNTCGGGGIPNVCGDPKCQKIPCLPAGGGQYCGTIGDGCGGTQNCAAPCPGGMACGTGALAGLCPGSTTNVCTGLACMVPTCGGAATTTLSGTVYDPAGKNPLYNAMVYVPNTALDPIPEGVSCDKCSAQLSGRPIATALSDASGHFVLSGVPAGTGIPAGGGIPLVIQVGKWRRQVSIPSITPCVDNPITDVNLTRLPRTQAEGHIPKIALTTGGSDALECFLRKTGIADTEFTTSAGTGRVNLFVGGEPTPTGGGKGAASFSAALGGATFPYATTLWNSPTQLLTYDILMMSCEGGQFATTKMPYVGNIKRYADSGGRLFNDHLHFYWLRNGLAPWPATATYIGDGPVPLSPINGTVNTTFPKGMALANWLVTVGASTVNGQIQLYDPRYSVAAVTPPTQGWITLNQSPPATEYLTFNTPVEAMPDAQCGRVVETDIHVKAVIPTQNGKDDSDPSKPFPTACLSPTTSAQEKALEFLFFDLSACVLPDGATPTPPPPGLSSTPPPLTPAPPATPPPPPPPPPPPIQ